MHFTKKPSFINKHSIAIHFILYVGAIFVMTPFNNKLIPVVTWIAMIIAIVILVYRISRPLTPLQKYRMGLDEYKKISGSALSSSFLFFISCLMFKYSEKVGIELIIALSVTTLGFMYYTITLYFKAVDDAKKGIVKKVFVVTKILWVIISFISYVLARNTFMEITDVTYESTFNKVTSFGLFLIFFSLFSTVIFLFSTMLLPVLQNALLPYNAWSICAPIFFATYIFFIAFNINSSRVLEYILDITIKYDTRDTFFCNNNYETLDKYPDARFMMVAEGNYRVFTPAEHDYGLWRLTCINSSPFYKMVEIQNKKEIENKRKKERN